MTKLELVKLVIEVYNNQSEWLDSLPIEIQSAFCDNAYVQSLHRINENALMLALGTELYEDLNWFLYDKPNGKTTVTFDGKPYDIETVKDYLSFVEEVYDVTTIE